MPICFVWYIHLWFLKQSNCNISLKCFQKNTSPIFFPFRLQLKMVFAFLQGFASINISIVIYLPPLNTQNTVSKNPIMVQLIFGKNKNKALVFPQFWKIPWNEHKFMNLCVFTEFLAKRVFTLFFFLFLAHCDTTKGQLNANKMIWDFFDK